MGKRNGIVLLLLVAACLNAQTNRALIIAVGDYPDDSGWDRIHAENDCSLIIPMLHAHGYDDTSITVLLNEEATKAQIVKAFQTLSMETRSGDYIYIHLSGHGQQMADDNGDEADGLDEAFIPYDARFRYRKGHYEGENHLRDDELEPLIDAIRRRAGDNGNVTVVIDACHSGTGTRIPEEEEYIRGTAYIFAPPNHAAVAVNAENFRLSLNRGAGLSPVSVFSACQPDQLNYEYRTDHPVVYYGSLTYFFCELMNGGNSEESTGSFYLRLKEKMENYFRKKNRKQSPYFECTDAHHHFIIGKAHGNSN